jgi:hypothetical protein
MTFTATLQSLRGHRASRARLLLGGVFTLYLVCSANQVSGAAPIALVFLLATDYNWVGFEHLYITGLQTDAIRVTGDGVAQLTAAPTSVRWVGAKKEQP